MPLHLQWAYQKLGYRPGDLSVTERVARGIFSFPMFLHLTAEQQHRIVERVLKYSCVMPGLAAGASDRAKA